MRTTFVHPAVLRFSIAFHLALLCSWSAGCIGSSEADRFVVSGTVTYEGNPIPVGFLTFAPDATKGNQGPGGSAVIEDGHFETPRNKGILGGAYIITISGNDGIPVTIDDEKLDKGKMLFRSYKTEHNFPANDSEWSFEVPSK